MANTLNFVNYSFEDLVVTLQNLLSAQNSWKDMYRSSTGQTLLELFAAVGNLVLYYVERRAEESYINTAQNYSSIVNLVRLLNYIPDRKVSSTGTLQFSISSAAIAIVIIPKWTSVSSAGYNFLTNEDSAIQEGGTSITVTGIQGTLTTVTYTSTGSTNQEYNINDTSIENTNVYVYVSGTNGGQPWTKQTSFINSTSLSTDYVIRPELDGTITIVFGNNVFGLAPAISSSIEVKYVRSDGSDGNVYSTGLITTLNSAIYDTDGTEKTVTVTNTTNFLGGDDAETAEEIRANGPNVFATGDRAVTKSDFESLLLSYPGVADVIVYGENDLTPPDYTMYNQVRICVLLNEWALPTTDFEALLTAYLYTKSMITVRYSYVDPSIIYVVPTVTVRLESSASISATQALVDIAIQNQFVLGATSTLGDNVYQSDIIQAVEDVSGVSNCHATLKIQKDLLQGYNSIYTYAETADLLPVMVDNVELWVNTTQIAVDNGAGSWTNLSTYTVTGIVVYTTGFVGVNVSPALPVGAEIFIRYQQNNTAVTIDSVGDLILSQTQICKWDSTTYTYIGY